jgi:type IV secretory pathway VirB3-like protein
MTFSHATGMLLKLSQLTRHVRTLLICFFIHATEHDMSASHWYASSYTPLNMTHPHATGILLHARQLIRHVRTQLICFFIHATERDTSARHWYASSYTPLNTARPLATDMLFHTRHWTRHVRTPLSIRTSYCWWLDTVFCCEWSCGNNSAIHGRLSNPVCTPLSTILYSLCPTISPMRSAFLSTVTLQFIKLFVFAFEFSARPLPLSNTLSLSVSRLC